MAEQGERHKLRSDITAAFTVALVGLPQCLAYAMMSGLPPAYGIATAVVPGFVAALVGKSPHVVTGPTNTTGLLILAALTPFLGETGLLEPSGLGALATLTLLAGTLRLLAAFAGGAALVDFIPESVLTGFTAGAGILIAVMQLDEGLGLAGVRAGSMLEQIQQVLQAVAGQQPAWPALVTTAATTVTLVLGKRMLPRFPTALLAVVAATALALAFDLDASRGLPVISDRAAVPSGWPQGAWPLLDVELMRRMIGPAAAIALLGTMELAVSARRGGARPDMKREVIAQGAANVVGAFTSAFPASASLTRSALLKLGGAGSRWAAALAALALIPILFVGADLVAAMPQASLAGVLFVTAIGMVDIRRMRRMWAASRMTRTLLAVTLLSTLVLPLEWAIFLGVGIGVGQHLASGRQPRLKLLLPEGDRLRPAEPEEAKEAPLVVVEITGDVHFAATSRVLEGSDELIPDSALHVVLELSHARALRFSALLAFEDLATKLRERGAELHLSGVDAEFVHLLEDTGAQLDFEPHDDEPLASLQRVLARIEEPPHSSGTRS